MIKEFSLQHAGLFKYHLFSFLCLFFELLHNHKIFFVLNNAILSSHIICHVFFTEQQ